MYRLDFLWFLLLKLEKNNRKGGYACHFSCLLEIKELCLIFIFINPLFKSSGVITEASLSSSSVQEKTTTDSNRLQRIIELKLISQYIIQDFIFGVAVGGYCRYSRQKLKIGTAASCNLKKIEAPTKNATLDDIIIFF